MSDTALEWILPDWAAPAQIHAFATTRIGGISTNGYRSLNLASHVEDEPGAVLGNRQRLRAALRLPAEPQWLEQTHSTRVIDLTHEATRMGDAAITRQPRQIAVVMTADCLPVLLCNQHGSEVAAAHAGWRGLHAGILEQTVKRMHSSPAQILAWLGPAISQAHFEVGEEVRDAFIRHDEQAASAFRPSKPGHYLADLYQLARQRLNKSGVAHISGGQNCTYAEAGRFFSFRREAKTGRQASMIWID